VLASTKQLSSAPDDADPTLRDPHLDTREPDSEQVQPSPLLPAFRAAGVTEDPPSPAADRGGKTRVQATDGPPRTSPLVQKVAVGALPLIFAGAGERSRLAARRGGRQRPLPAGPISASESEAAALGQVSAGQPAEVSTDLAQYQLVGGTDAKPRADAGTRRVRHHERCGDRTKPTRHRGGHSCV